jgi:hypothetical protein
MTDPLPVPDPEALLGEVVRLRQARHGDGRGMEQVLPRAQHRKPPTAPRRHRTTRAGRHMTDDADSLLSITKSSELAELVAQVNAIKPGKGDQIAIRAADHAIDCCRLVLDFHGASVRQRAVWGMLSDDPAVRRLLD